MKKPLLLAAALAVLATPALHAAEGDAAKAPAKPVAASPEEQANFLRAANILRLFNDALRNKDVTQPVKNKLVSCMYNSTLKQISAATAEVFTKNPSLKKDDSTVLYRAAAAVCGVTYKRADAPAAGAAPKPAPKPAPAGNGDSR